MARLAFKNGEGKGRVHIETKSGGVRLCAKDLRDSHAATAPTAKNCDLIVTPGSAIGSMSFGERVRYLPLL